MKKYTWIHPVFSLIAAATFSLAVGAQPTPSKLSSSDRNSEDHSSLQTVKLKTVKIAGKWRYAWDVRGGTMRGIMVLKQNASQVTGTFFEEIVGQTFSLSGNIQGKDVTFDVAFPEGTRPYTIEFTGTVDRGRMTGTSAMKGGGQVFLGHAGEVDEPQRPWLAIKGLKHQVDTGRKPPKDDDD